MKENLWKWWSKHILIIQSMRRVSAGSINKISNAQVEQKSSKEGFHHILYMGPHCLVHFCNSHAATSVSIFWDMSFWQLRRVDCGTTPAEGRLRRVDFRELARHSYKVSRMKLSTSGNCIYNESQRECQIFKRTSVNCTFPQIVSAPQNVIMTFTPYKNHL